MYKIVAVNKATLDRKEFELESAEDAKVYKQYHLRFGHWSEGTYWTEEKTTTEELRPFIVDEKTELVNGSIKRYYQICTNWSIAEEVVTNDSLLGAWLVLRRDREQKLKDTDWTQMSDVPLTTAERGEWKKYRQYLRDFPKLHTDATVATAVIADFKDWRNGAR